MVEFLDICPEEVLPFTPKILAHMLPAMASTKETIHQAATRVNSCLMDYVVLLSDEPAPDAQNASQLQIPASASRQTLPVDKSDGVNSNRASVASSRELDVNGPYPGRSQSTPVGIDSAQSRTDLDYAAAVNSLTLLFLNDHEATRVAALTWLIMLHRKAPRKVLAFNDGTFPALLKTLSDPSDAVVTKDLQLLSQISRNSADDYFANFMVNLLQLFSTDRKLLETRGNLIIRQLCISLSPERIYRTLADCIEKEEDVEFASIMVQNLNNNLITAPQLADVRKRLRNLEAKVPPPGHMLHLYPHWLTCMLRMDKHFSSPCSGHGATTLLPPSPCACWRKLTSRRTTCCRSCESLMQCAAVCDSFSGLSVTSGELDMTVNILIQVDKLVQLIESPVFTCK